MKAFQFIRCGNANYAKDDNWTVYRTAGCIRIDIQGE